MRTLLIVLLIGLCAGVTFADPAVTITSVFPWDPGNFNGYISGTVTGVDYSQYVVAPLLYVDGLGWYSKPSFSSPSVNINPDGTWTALVTTGGLDTLATGFVAELFPKTDAIPLVNGSVSPPSTYTAFAYQPRYYGTTINWSNYDWMVKTSCLPWGGYAVGPGNNRFTDDPNYVWKDASNKIHIKLQKNSADGNFYSGELFTKNTFGYGLFTMETASNVNSLPANVTMGSMFTWCELGSGTSNPNKEIDTAEFSRWGNTDPAYPIAQDVIQPYGNPGNIHRFAAPDDTLVNMMDWEQNYIDFTIMTKKGVLVDHWRYTGPDIPVPGDVHIHMNGWFNTTPPADQQPVELILNSFAYTISTWKGGYTASWDAANNWTSQVVPNGAGTTVSFGTQVGNNTVDLHLDKIVGNLSLFNTTNITINGNGHTLTLDNNGSPSSVMFVGNHSILAPVLMDNDVTVSGTGTLNMNNVTGHHTLSVNGSVYATSIAVDTLSIGEGAVLTIAAMPGGPLSESLPLTPLPEPAAWAMLLLAAMGPVVRRLLTCGLRSGSWTSA